MKTDLIKGVGKCSVPMWRMGIPAGFCNNPAYGEQEAGQLRYDGYVPNWACPIHGGPDRPKVAEEKTDES